jgi:2-phosphoglycerate kinase
MSPPPHVIWVRTGRQSIPFSHGILTKSLTQAGVGVEEAYALAEEIENEMEAAEKEEVEADDLMGLTVEKLRDRGLTKAANNYLVWRSVRKLKAPIIILIGGGTGVGKSTVSTEIAFRLGINYTISTDTIREVMRRMITTELMPTLATSSFEAADTINLPTFMIDKAIYAFERQVSGVSVGIDAVLERAVKESINMIIDGVHVVPGYYVVPPQESILFQFVLHVSDVEQHKAHFDARAMGSHRTADRYISKIDQIRRIQEFIVERAQADNIPIIDNMNLEDTSETILSIITDRLKEEMD